MNKLLFALLHRVANSDANLASVAPFVTKRSVHRRYLTNPSCHGFIYSGALVPAADFRLWNPCDEVSYKSGYVVPDRSFYPM